MKDELTQVKVQHFAVLKDKTGLEWEDYSLQNASSKQLFIAIQNRHQINLNEDLFQVAVNDEFVSWNQELHSGDKIVFIPPMTGG